VCCIPSALEPGTHGTLEPFSTWSPLSFRRPFGPALGSSDCDGEVRQTRLIRDTKLVESAGEHWVCFALARLGWGAALTRDGLERTDVLAVRANDLDRRMVEIQVKASSGFADYTRWRINEKAQQPALSDREWFALVLMGDTLALSPRAFIIPRDHLAAAAWIQHMAWLTDSSVPKGQRNAPVSAAQIQAWMVKSYKNRWDLMEAPATQAPVLLPPEFRSMDRPEQARLLPQHRQIGDRLTARRPAAPRDRSTPDPAHAPNGVVGLDRPWRRTLAAARPPRPHRPAAGPRHATPRPDRLR
jgi:hypothetical protein